MYRVNEGKYGQHSWLSLCNVWSQRSCHPRTDSHERDTEKNLDNLMLTRIETAHHKSKFMCLHHVNEIVSIMIHQIRTSSKTTEVEEKSSEEWKALKKRYYAYTQIFSTTICLLTPVPGQLRRLSALLRHYQVLGLEEIALQPYLQQRKMLQCVQQQ